jgi:hypothetical protein
MLRTLQRNFPYFGRKLSQIEFELSELRLRYSGLQVSSELELGHLKNRIQELEKENEFILVQLFQAQSELDRPSPDFLELKSQFEELKREKNKVEITFLEKENEVKVLQREVDSSVSRYADLIKADKLLQKEVEVLKSRIVELSDVEHAHQLLLRNYEVLEKDFQAALQKLQDVTNLNAKAKESELLVIEVENDRLLKNLHKTQEDLESLYLESEKNKNTANVFTDRWARLQQRLPSYVDFSNVRIDVKEISGQDQVVWSVSDYFKSGKSIDYLSFATVLVDGVSGIGILEGEFQKVFYPSLVIKSTTQRDLFLGFNYSQIQKIEAAINVMDAVLDSQWSIATLDQNFDQQFWRNSISMLIAEFRKLPALLRINLVKLKLEVQNIDYENLWLEFHDVAYGNFYAKKIELRIGAAMINPDGFSRYPKIEIPLVDGIEKPFSGWYAESSDTYGQKLEFRFDLDKQIMDMQAWSKLVPKDIGFCAALVSALPRVLSGLRDEKILIGRDWSTWIDFALGVVTILNKSRAPASVEIEEEKVAVNTLEIDYKMPGKTLDTVQSKPSAKKSLSITGLGKKIKKITVTTKKK